MEELDPENLSYIEVRIHAYKYTTATCQYLVYFC